MAPPLQVLVLMLEGKELIVLLRGATEYLLTL